MEVVDLKKSSKKLSFSKGLREDVSIYRTNLKYCGQNSFSLLLSYFLAQYVLIIVV